MFEGTHQKRKTKKTIRNNHAY